MSKAILAVWNDVDPAIEDDYNEWYAREHVPDRTSVPGIIRGRRYRAESGSPKYMAFYEAETMAVLTSGVYRMQLDNPTEWTRRVMPYFTFAQRGLCDVVASVGRGVGGAAVVVHVSPGDQARLRGWIIATLLPELLALPGVTAAHCWALAPGEPRSLTSGLSPHAGPEQAIEWVIVIEAMEVSTATTIRSAILSRVLIAHGAAEVRPYPVYRLLYTLEGS